MWAAIVRLVSQTILGELFGRLLRASASTVFKALTNRENNRKAYEFVKELYYRTDMTASEKAQRFNLMMLAWAEDVGRELKDSTINCLREFALSVLKSEIEMATAKK